MAKSPSGKTPTVTSGPVRLANGHNRAAFSCGKENLDIYLKHRATQDERRGVAYPYVIADGTNNVVAYYTLTAASILVSSLPDKLKGALPRHSTFGASLVGRLAVDQQWQGLGLGSIMIAHAVTLAFNQSPTASIALIVDAIDSKAVAFYKAHDFIAMPDNAQSLFLVRDTLAKYLLP